MTPALLENLLGTNLLAVSIGRDFGALQGVSNTCIVLLCAVYYKVGAGGCGILLTYRDSTHTNAVAHVLSAMRGHQKQQGTNTATKTISLVYR